MTNDRKRKPQGEPRTDAGPTPQEFRPPKDLSRVETPGEFEVKSGAAQPAPAPVPTGAHVRMDKPPAQTPPRIPIPGPGEFDVRKPALDPSKLPKLAEPGEFDVVKPSLDPRKLPKLEEPGPFDVVLPGASPTPRPLVEPPVELGEVDVVPDSSQRGSLSVGASGEPFTALKKIGIVDTTFARFNMGDAAEDELNKQGAGFEVVRRTVPGIKDLPVECKLLLERYDCDLVLACGMVGGQPVDKQCAHEASLAMQWAMLATNKHILEVFVHEDETTDERQLAWLMDRRTREHAENAFAMLLDPDRLRRNAGKGLRQGFDDEGPIPLA